MESLVTVFYTKFAGAPLGWITSAAGRGMIAKALRMIRQRESRDNAKYLRNLLTVVKIVDTQKQNPRIYPFGAE